MKVLPVQVVGLAESQLGVVARYQLRRWLTVGQADFLVNIGYLVRVERGVYRVAGGAAVPQQAPFAAALRARPDATVTGPAVLGHLGVDGYRANDPFEVLVRPGRRLHNVGFAWREDPRHRRGVQRCGDVRLTGPLDALCDAADPARFGVDDRTVRLGFDWLCWNGVLSRTHAIDQLQRKAATDLGGARVMELLGGTAFAACESDEERQLGAVLARFDPTPEPQVTVAPLVRVDWYFRRLRLAIEFDGGVDHHRPDRQAADAERDARLAGLGIVVVRYTAADLDDEVALISSLASRLTTRALQLGLPAPAFR